MRILLTLILTVPAWAALPSTVVAEVRTTGAQTNGGGWDTAGTGVDMSQYDNKNASGCSSCYSSSANLSTTDAVANGTTTITSATAAFTSAIDGNVIFLNNQWYRATYVDATTITVDRTVTTATGLTMNIGGAFKIGGTLDDDFFESFEAGNTIYIKAGTYTEGETVSLSKTGSVSNPIKIIGYNSTRGDAPRRSGATDNRPLINVGIYQFALGSNWEIYNVRLYGTASQVIQSGANSKVGNCQVYNISTTANLIGLQTSTDTLTYDSEIVSFRGRAVALGNASSVLIGNYIHSSNEGIYGAYSNIYQILYNVIEDITSSGIYFNAVASANVQIIGNTILGSPTPRASSTGVKFITGVTDVRLINNIIAGWATGVSHADTQSVGLDLNNVYYNNTANTNGSGNWAISSTSTTASDPSFTAHTRINGSTATSSTNVITAGSGTPFTNVVDGTDFVWVSSGSGTGFATGIYPISAHTGTTITLAWNGTNFNVTSSGSGSAIVWEIIQGHDFSVGAAIKGLGYPTVWSGLGITNYLDPGAVQRPEGSGSGGTRIY